MLYTSPWSKFELTTSVVIGTVCADSCKSNYHIDGEEVSGNIKEFMLGACKHFACGHFIITSRRNPTEINESCNISDVNCIFIESLSDTEAKVFLQKRTGCSTDDSNCHICRVCHGTDWSPSCS